MKKLPTKSHLPLKIIVLFLITLILLIPFYFPHRSWIQSSGTKSVIYFSPIYEICFIDEVEDITNYNPSKPDESPRVTGKYLIVFGHILINDVPEGYESMVEGHAQYSEKPLEFLKLFTNIYYSNAYLFKWQISIVLTYSLYALVFFLPRKIKLPDRNAVCRYADLYRIIKLKKPNPDKDGEFIEGKKIAICGITVRDDCPDEVFLGFPTYKKSRKMLEKDEGEGG